MLNNGCTALCDCLILLSLFIVPCSESPVATATMLWVASVGRANLTQRLHKNCWCAKLVIRRWSYWKLQCGPKQYCVRKIKIRKPGCKGSGPPSTLTLSPVSLGLILKTENLRRLRVCLMSYWFLNRKLGGVLQHCALHMCTALPIWTSTPPPCLRYAHLMCMLASSTTAVI